MRREGMGGVNWKRWRVLILGAIVSIAAIGVIRAQMNLDELMLAFARANYLYLIPASALTVCGLVFRALRWRALLSEGIRYDRAFNILNVAYFANGVLPFRMGEVLRAYLATRVSPPVPMLTSGGSIIIERLLDLLAVLVILALAVSAAPLPGELRAAALFFAPLTLAGFLVLLVLSSQRALAVRVLDALTRRVPALARLNLHRWAGHFLDGLVPLTRPALAAKALACTAIAWAFSLGTGYVLMLAFYDRGDWAAVALFTASASFAVAVPAVPGNLGTYELSILLALGSLGYGEPLEVATAFAVMVHAVNLGINAVLGIIGFMREGMTVRTLSDGIRAGAAETSSAASQTASQGGASHGRA